MKTAAMIVLMTGFLLLGRAKAARYEERVRVLNYLCLFINLSRESIAYLSLPPHKIVEVAKKRQDLKSAPFIEYLAKQNISQEGFSTHFSRALSSLPLKESEKQLLISFGETLGKSDRESQLLSCDSSLNRLSQLKEEAEKECGRLSKMWTSLGLIGGIFAVILLI